MCDARAGLPSSLFLRMMKTKIKSQIQKYKWTYWPLCKVNKQTNKQTNHKYKNTNGPTDLSVRWVSQQWVGPRPPGPPWVGMMTGLTPSSEKSISFNFFFIFFLILSFFINFIIIFFLFGSAWWRFSLRHLKSCGILYIFFNNQSQFSIRILLRMSNLEFFDAASTIRLKVIIAVMYIESITSRCLVAADRGKYILKIQNTKSENKVC